MSEQASTGPTPHGANTVDPRALRAAIDANIAAGRPVPAAQGLARLWHHAPDNAAAGFICGRYEKLLGLQGAPSLTPLRIAILRSFTVETITPLLKADAFTWGLHLSVHVGEFGAYAQELINPADPLHTFNPQALILAVDARSVTPELYTRFADLSAADVAAAVSDCAARYSQWIDAWRQRSDGAMIIHLLAPPGDAAHGALDAQQADGQSAAFAEINRRIRAAAAERSGVYCLDYPALVARHGHAAWHDERKWLTARAPISARCAFFMAREWMKFLQPVSGRVAKALVCDLDNTLWGGVIGEDGMTGIKLDAEYPGAAFQSLQRTILDLYQRGVILAVNSKNNHADAMEAIEKHPGMLLRPNHFAAIRANWQDKASNMREIAEELNIGIDSLVFIDDNPAERQWVREQVPEMTVLELPADPFGYAQAVRDCPLFQRLSLSAEDKARGRYYAEERLRTEFEKKAPSLEEFYRSLEMSAEIGRVSDATLARVAQLTQKTNQFNTTTRRYSEQQIRELAADPAWRIYWIRLADRFGDNGIVGVALSRTEGDTVEIDTFLLSCRVIGRAVEIAFMSHILAEAAERGATKAFGWFIPTKKNAPTKDFYPKVVNFTPAATEPDGRIRYELDLSAGGVAWPDWIRREQPVSDDRPLSNPNSCAATRSPAGV